MNDNISFGQSRRHKFDEFHTRYEDIEDELIHYRDQFRDKVIYCNCDQPGVSNFHRYFIDNFRELSLRRLLVSAYHKDESNLLNCGERRGEAEIFEYDGTTAQSSRLRGNGDFRSDECIELLKRADIVVTNPPFSLFREYVAQLMEYRKMFLILGNINALSYRDIFPLFRDNRMWLGNASMTHAMFFDIPDEYRTYLIDNKNSNNAYYRVTDDGRIQARVSATWMTNMTGIRRRDLPELECTYNPDEYPMYDNMEAINVDRVCDIPVDWPGLMGVPITFFNSHNPDQFEIVSFRKGNDGKDLSVGGDIKYARVIIRNLNPRIKIFGFPEQPA